MLGASSGNAEISVTATYLDAFLPRFLGCFPVGILELVVVAVALAADAFAVALAQGTRMRRPTWRETARVAVLFGLFQALMPLIGWALGVRFLALIATWDHWVVFAVLALLGARMIHEAFGEEEPGVPRRDPFALAPLVAMAFATSIDALAAGLTLPVLEVPVGAAVACIGLVTFALCLVGVKLAHVASAHLGRKLDALGGFVLIGLGVKILLEHTLAG